MANQFQPSSFIPKKPLVKSEPAKRKKSVSISTVAASIIFLVSLGLAGGVYVVQTQAIETLDQKKVELQRSKEAFDPEVIAELSKLDSQIMAATELLDSHIAVSPLFDILEEHTLEAVQFTDLRYTENSGSFLEIFMNGEAESFTAIALQADSLAENESVSSPIFSNFNLIEDPDTQEATGVTFQVRLLVARPALTYTNVVQ